MTRNLILTLLLLASFAFPAMAQDQRQVSTSEQLITTVAQLDETQKAKLLEEAENIRAGKASTVEVAEQWPTSVPISVRDWLQLPVRWGWLLTSSLIRESAPLQWF